METSPEHDPTLVSPPPALSFNDRYPSTVKSIIISFIIAIITVPLLFLGYSVTHQKHPQECCGGTIMVADGEVVNCICGFNP